MSERDDSSRRGGSLSPAAQDLEKSIKSRVDDLLDTSAGGEPELSPETKGMLLGSTVVDLMAEDAKVDPEDRPFSMRPIWVWLLLIAIVALGAAAIAGAMIFLREDAGSGTAAPTVPATQPAPSDLGGQPTPVATSGAADPAEVAAPADTTAPDTWRFTGKWGLDVTLTLLPKGDGFGRISVKGEPDAKGSYTWNGSSLKINYRQPVTLLTGNVVDTKGRFTCKGEPTSTRLRCTIRSLGWTSTSTSQSSSWLRFTATGRPIE